MEETDKKKCCNNHNSCPRCKCRSEKKLKVYDWLEDIPESHTDTDFVEVQFKNTRKGYYRNSNKLDIAKGDIVAVEASPGHDIGEVTLTGVLVLLQMKKNNVRFENQEVKRVYRKAKPADIEKFEEAKAKEHNTMLRARKIAEDLNLNMKIGDVEYQGDGNKAIFYYIADDRVDFRQLIKVLAENFKVRIEMKQIGARQEAGRIGGIGPCGRELCCSGWMTNFVSVATSAARYQEISLNPQKLAGQCAKLKCCLNYEVDGYVEAQKKLPSKDAVLYTKSGEYYHFKTDIYKYQLTYSTSKDFPANLITLPSSRVFEIIALNKRGIKVDALEESKEETVRKEFSDVVGQDSLTRFDKTKKNKRNKNKRHSKDEDNTPDNERDISQRDGSKENNERQSDDRNFRNSQNRNNKREQRGESRNGNDNHSNSNREHGNQQDRNRADGNNNVNRNNSNKERNGNNNQPAPVNEGSVKGEASNRKKNNHPNNRNNNPNNPNVENKPKQNRPVNNNESANSPKDQSQRQNKENGDINNEEKGQRQEPRNKNKRFKRPKRRSNDEPNKDE